MNVHHQRKRFVQLSQSLFAVNEDLTTGSLVELVKHVKFYVFCLADFLKLIFIDFWLWRSFVSYHNNCRSRLWVMECTSSDCRLKNEHKVIKFSSSNWKVLKNAEIHLNFSKKSILRCSQRKILHRDRTCQLSKVLRSRWVKINWKSTEKGVKEKFQ